MLVIPNEWKNILNNKQVSDIWDKLCSFVEKEYCEKTIFPPKDKIFSALGACPPSSTKIIILGQDPYHNYNQANGMCFSVNKGTALPPSLINIYKAMQYDLNDTPQRYHEGDLSYLAQQGVLLLNTCFSVELGKPNSHSQKGWEELSDAIIEYACKQGAPLVFMLWGKPACSKIPLIKKWCTNTNHLILTAPHPSPLSFYRGFLTCKHFSQANEFLSAHGKATVDWISGVSL